MHTPRFMYGMQVGKKSQYVYTQIHVRYVGRTESHNMYTPRFMYGMQVGQKVTICIHLDSCTVCTCRQDRKSQYVYTQIHVRYVGRTESHNMYTLFVLPTYRTRIQVYTYCDFRSYLHTVHESRCMHIVTFCPTYMYIPYMNLGVYIL